MRIRPFLAFVYFVFTSPFFFAQEPPGALPAAPVPIFASPQKSIPGAASSDPDNRHVRILRFKIPADESVDLPKLANEGLLLCLKGDLLRRIPEGGNGEPWESGPGSALWNHGGVAYNLENRGPGVAEILLIELKDSYAISQIRVPYSEFDPLLVDAPHFRVMLDNEHVRVLLLHLKPRDGTEQSQFGPRLEIALNDVDANEEFAGGKLLERKLPSSEVAWKEAQLKSIINAGDKVFDVAMVELKHPFCYQVEFNNEKAEKNPELKKYMSDTKAKISKFWLKKISSGIRDGDTGYVSLQIKVQNDGTVLEDGIVFREVFGSDTMVQKGLNAVRDASPFAPFPKSMDVPYVSIGMVFDYNLPLRPSPGCHD
ncbi:MAG TPA: hypothetical protein VKP58_00660 [Candidatus Acidoferrum sp.]|nr:hypothetical protein [Candidatus Acidoferrum sp.]